jgi:hypothetical protein
MNKFNCNKHDEYHIYEIGEHPNHILYGAGDHCPDCQRALAESWADRLKEEWYWKPDKVLSPDGAFKAWEYAESKGWCAEISHGEVCFSKIVDHCKECKTCKEISTEIYFFSKYTKPIAIMLAALEAVNSQEVEG